MFSPTHFGSNTLLGRELPLRWALMVPFLLLVGVVAFTGLLSFDYGRQAVNDVAEELTGELTARIRDFSSRFLEEPHEVTKRVADAIKLGELDIEDSGALQRHFFHCLAKDFGFVFFGAPEGGLASAGRREDETLVVAATDFDPDRGLIAGVHSEYLADASGNPGELFESLAGYDASQRPWYQAAILKKDAVWSPIYRLFVQNSLAIAASRPVYDERGELLGVVGVDLLLSGIGEFLEGLNLGESGVSFIADRSGYLVASSTLEDPVLATGASGTMRRRRLVETKGPRIRATAQAIVERFGNLEWIEGEQQLTFDLDGERQFVRVVPLQADLGLEWLIVTILPEADFMQALVVSRRRVVVLCLGALIIAAAFGLRVSRWMARPIVRLSEASRAIAGGEFNQRVDVHGIRELSDLAQSFNRMGGQLEDAFEELETRVAERTSELHDAKEAAVAGSRAKSLFLANISHEIRTPLGAILGYAELLHADPGRGDEEAALYLEAIRHQGSHLDQLLRDLLDLSRIEAGRLELDPQPCELSELLFELVSVFGPPARERGLELMISTEQELPWHFVVDAVRVRQIVSNLLSNAIKYTESGRVTLAIESAHQPGHDGREASAERAKLTFVVADTGVGISEADQPLLFRRFTQLEPAGDSSPTAADPRSGGFGLGLAITHQLSELMGGTVGLESRVGHGSSFHVELPVEGCDDWGCRTWELPRAQSSVFLPELQPLSGRVLIAEDSRSLQLLCKRMLERWGVHCETADNGREAVERVREHGFFDVILMDWQMPEMDGLAATRELRRLGCCTPIVALTAAAMFGDRERCLEAGCNRYLVKPIDFRELHRLIGRLLGQLEHTGKIPVQQGKPAGPPAEGFDDELATLVCAFVERLPLTVADLRAALVAQEWDNFDSLVHRLVGTAGTYGLNEIFRAAERLESEVRERNTACIERSLERLAAAVREAVRACEMRTACEVMC